MRASLRRVLSGALRTGIRPLQIAVVFLGGATSAEALDGRLVSRESSTPIAGATLTVVGSTITAITDAEGRFRLVPDPRPPFTVIIILPGGRLAKSVLVEKLEGTVLILTADTAVTEAVTVTAGVAPGIQAAPGAALTLLSSREMELRSPANLAGALESVPGVSQVSEGQASVPAIRGLARGRTLILIDGGRVSSERRVGPSATFMDPAVVEGIDVARGPGSVAYGSDSFGGVIAVRTRRPSYEGLQISGSGTMGFGVPERRGDLTVSKGFGTGGVLISVHGRTSGDYDGPDGVVPNSGWSDSGVLLRAERRVGAGLFGVSLQSDFARDIERPRNNSTDVRFYSPFENSHRVTASYERGGLGEFSLVSVSGFVGAIEQRTDQDRTPTATSARNIARADIASQDFQLRATAKRVVASGRLEFGMDLNGRLGLEAHDITVLYDLAGNEVATTDTLSVESATRTDTGFFLQGEHPLMPLVSAAGGVRVDYVRSENTGGHFGDRSVSNHALAGFGSLTVGPLSHMTVVAQVSRGFREPTLSDRFFRGPSGRGFITGNPDLDPETSLQFDLGVRLATRRVRAATYFYDYGIRNLVERYPTTPVDSFAFRNRGRAHVRGWEGELQTDFGAGYSLELAAQVGRGRAVDDNASLDDVAPESLSLGLRRAITSELLAFVRVAVYADDDRPGPSEIAVPGHTNIDVGASWSPTRPLEIRGLVRNVLNQEYYASPEPRFVLAPGISGSITVAVRY